MITSLMIPPPTAVTKDKARTPVRLNPASIAISEPVILKEISPIESLSISIKGAFNQADLRYWLSTLLFDRSDTVYRMKGIIHVAGREEKLIFQSVHRLFEDAIGPKWEDGEEKMSKIVFIGEKLDKEELKKGFSDCLE